MVCTTTGTTSCCTITIMGGEGITVLSPNGGETWQRGKTYTVTWSYTSGTTGNVILELLQAGTPVGTINSGDVTPVTNGSYTWAMNPIGLLGSNFTVRVKSALNPTTVFGTSNSPFTIIPAVTDPCITNPCGIGCPDAIRCDKCGNGCDENHVCNIVTGNCDAIVCTQSFSAGAFNGTFTIPVNTEFTISLVVNNTGNCPAATPVVFTAGGITQMATSPTIPVGGGASVSSPKYNSGDVAGEIQTSVTLNGVQVGTGTITVTSLPIAHFVGGKLTITPDVVPTGAEVTVSQTITNDGTAPAAPIVDFYMGSFKQTVTGSFLNPKEFVTVSATFTTDSFSEGTTIHLCGLSEQCVDICIGCGGIPWAGVIAVLGVALIGGFMMFGGGRGGNGGKLTPTYPNAFKE